MLNKSLIIFGSGGHATSVADVAISQGYQIRCFIDGGKKQSNTLHGVPIVSVFDVQQSEEDIYAALAIGDNYSRMRKYSELSILFPRLIFPTLVHREASVGSWSSLGQGTVIMAGARIGANCKVGKFAIVNTNSSLDHDSTLDDFASMAPGANTGGNVFVGLCSAIGIGACLKHGIRVGSHSVVGSSSYLAESVENNVVFYGVPAKRVRGRSDGESYL